MILDANQQQCDARGTLDQRSSGGLGHEDFINRAMRVLQPCEFERNLSLRCHRFARVSEIHLRPMGMSHLPMCLALARRNDWLELSIECQTTTTPVRISILDANVTCPKFTMENCLGADTGLLEAHCMNQLRMRDGLERRDCASAA